MRRPALAASMAGGTCAFAVMLIPSGQLGAASNDGGAPTDAAIDAPSTTPGCRLDLAGATYALMDCKVVHEHRAWTYAFDSGIDPSPRVVIIGGGTGAFPAVDLWLHVRGEPRVGSQS